MSYEQAIKHFKNHRKDRYYQQCSGYFGDGESTEYNFTDEQISRNSKESMKKILSTEHNFPIYLHQESYGIWKIVPSNHLFGTKINNQDELIKFADDYS